MSDYLPRKSFTLLETAVAAVGAAFYPESPSVSFQVTEAGTGTVSCTVVIETTNDPTNANSWITVCTISITGTTTAKDASPKYPVLLAVRASIAGGAIAGTGAVAKVTMSY